MKKKNDTIKINKIVIIGVVLSFLVLAIKLGIVALATNVDGMNLKEFANNRNTAKRTLYASRGSIYDSTGEVLATTVNSYTVIAYLDDSRTTDINNPLHVIDKVKTAKELSPILNMSEDYILSLLNKDLYQVELGPNGRGISELTKDQIEALDLPGISFISAYKRNYKMGTFAPYIIGYAKENADGKLIGEMGIESYFNDELTGVDGYTEYQKDIYGYQIPNTPSITEDSINGSDIYLTLDSNIQMFVENALNELSHDYEITWATFSVMEAKTGAIVASASNPTFNLNKLDMNGYLNPLVSYEYEPGSTMKVFSFMGAIEKGIYDGSATYESGTIKVADYTIKDHNGKGWGTITYDEGFSYSSNVAATKLALEMGSDYLSDFYKRLGFGAKTGITLPGEAIGNLNMTYKTELATASYGHGITTTPIQNLQALTVLSNDGVMLKPYIVDKIVDSNGEVTYKGERTEIGKVVSSDTVKKMQTMMYDVVYSNKTDAQYYKPDNTTLMGKTGTALISYEKGYLDGEYDYIRSFAGLFPYENPEYIIYVSFKQFKGPFKVAITAVKEVVEEIAKYKDLVDTSLDVDLSKIVTVNDYINQKTDEVKSSLEGDALTPIIIGTGEKVVNQYPKKSTSLVAGSKVFILTNNNNYVMPDVSEWSANEIITFCNLIGLDYTLNGYGIVKDTSIETGQEIDLNTTININLAQ